MYYQDSSDTCPSALSFLHFFIYWGCNSLPLPAHCTWPCLPSFPSFADKLKEMEKSKMRCCMGLFLMLLLVLAAQEAEGRMCQSQSHGFHGACVSSHNCALVCRNEGFSGGRCRGFRRRCFCTKLC